MSGDRTFRERREARAERLRGWAAAAEQRAEAIDREAHDMASVIPFGQPVLAGHHSQGSDQRYRSRIVAKTMRAVEEGEKARRMSGRAANIEASLAVSIYDDDPGAADRLAERIAAAEAERDRIKRFNASCRRGTPDLSLLDDRQRRDVESAAKVGFLRADGSLPAYHLANLNGRITRDRQRLARLRGTP